MVPPPAPVGSPESDVAMTAPGVARRVHWNRPMSSPASSTRSRPAARVKRAPAGAVRARRKFLRFFPHGFDDPDYLDTERGYKWAAHERWIEALAPVRFRELLRANEHERVAEAAVRIESRTNLLFSFEKMALRDAVRSPAGAREFATGLYALLHGGGTLERRFERWIDVVARLPRKQTRVSTWPLITVFGFIAQPSVHLFLKPNVTRVAAERYGFDFAYHSRPSWETYASLLAFGEVVRRDTRGTAVGRARDQIDVQSFIWVQGSDEYAE
jgi:hypothetical protein